MTIEQLNKQILEGKTRNCKKCNQELPVSNFHIKHDKNTNHFRFNSPCKKCAHENRNIEYRKVAARKKKYNLTSEDYNAMLISQNNSCDICNIDMKEYGKNFVVDHCHVTNNVRGLLCNNCNTGIGMLQDNTSILIKAIEYLKKRSSK
jgi:RNase P subunit RPR2